MIDRPRFELLEKKWGQNSSWAVWTMRGHDEPVKAGAGDLQVFDLDKNLSLLSTLNPNIVLVGLNVAGREYPSISPWVNFHDSRSASNDHKIRFALDGTACWGAYMTDLFAGLHETDSAKIKTWMRESPDQVEMQLQRFRSELDDLRSDAPLLIAFGGLVYETLQRFFGSSFRIIKIPHYAIWGSEQQYREQVLQVFRRESLI